MCGEASAGVRVCVCVVKAVIFDFVVTFLVPLRKTASNESKQCLFVVKTQKGFCDHFRIPYTVYTVYKIHVRVCVRSGVSGSMCFGLGFYQGSDDVL